MEALPLDSFEPVPLSGCGTHGAFTLLIFVLQGNLVELDIAFIPNHHHVTEPM